jgi:hypothetical protein
MRKSAIYLTITVINIALCSALFMHAAVRRKDAGKELASQANIVKEYQLTDLVLFTEARYTRHPSMADLNTPFQDYPFSFEHFPSGSLMPVPPGIRR